MNIYKARWWHKEQDNTRCTLCFHRCLLEPGNSGICGVRTGTEKGLDSPYLGRFSSCAVDPVEKKPLLYWRPGSLIFSLGSVGCTMRCPFCQNGAIAQPSRFETVPLAELSPQELLQKVAELDLNAVAYTYNEPTLQAEYILEAAPVLKNQDIATVLVSNGMFSCDVLREFTAHTAAANIDIKTFNVSTYAQLGGSLKTVLANVTGLFEGGVHVELTHLVVPGISDDPLEFSELVDWVAQLSPQIPLHISRYFPAYRYTAPPTEIIKMKDFYSIARHKLLHVHLGNVPPGLL